MTPRPRRACLFLGASLLVASLSGVAARQTAARTEWLKATTITENEAVHAGTNVRLAIRATVAEGLHVQSDRPRDPNLKALNLSIDAPEGITFGRVVFPPPSEFRLTGADSAMTVFEGQFDVGVALTIGKDVRVGPVTIPARLRYQACNATTCFQPKTLALQWTLRVVPSAERLTAQHPEIFRRIAFDRGQPPQPPLAAPSAPPAPASTSSPGSTGLSGLALLDRFTILGKDEGYLSSTQFLTFIRDAERGVKARGPFEGQGPLAILAIVFVGGLALNLTPCVLPMIPINLAIIGAGAQRSRRSRGFLLGATYGGAMAFVYGVLGLVVILTAGTFGTINASPWFNVGIAALFVVLGLAMFDVLSLDFSRWSSRIRFGPEKGGTLMLAFSMGAIAALLAGACVAPVVVQVVVFASNLYAAGTPSALALPFVLGLGMALPWPLAGAGLTGLPKPGAWMVRVKHVLGVFILATAAYYGYVAYGIFANRWVDPARVKASVDAELKAGWHASLVEGLQIAERDKTPVLIDFWATWCKNCLTMDETTLKSPEVKAALSRYTLIKYQAESPDESPTKELMQRVGSRGLPTYVILKPPS